MSTDHPDSDLLDQYALGCLEGSEARAIGEHVRGCASCRKLLAENENLLGDLASLIAPVDPPARLEDAVMARLSFVTPSFASRRAGIRRPALLAAVAVILVALVAGNVAQWISHTGQKTGQVVPGLSLIVLAGRGESADAYGTVVLDPKDDGGVLAVRGLKRLDAVHVYQLWMIRSGEARSGGTFTVSEDGYGNLLLEVPKDFRDFTSIVITREPLGGGSVPSEKYVAQGESARP